MGVRYEVTLRPDQMTHIRNLLLGEAEDLLALSDELPKFTAEQRETYEVTKHAVEELLVDFTVDDPRRSPDSL